VTPSEHQLEQADHHDQADDENDSRRTTDEFQHAVPPLIGRL